MPHILVNDVNFYYEIHGSNEPSVVFISGYTCDHNLWAPILKQLSEQYRCLIFDNQGIGETTDNGEILTAKSMAKNIVALFNQLGLEKPILIGYAMGSNLALEIAINYPDKISKMILLNAVAKWSNFALQAIDEMFAAEKTNNAEQFFELLAQYVFSKEFWQDENNRDRFKSSQNSIKQSIENQARQINVLKTFDITDDLYLITTPTIVVGLKFDVLATKNESQQLTKKISRAEYVELATGHVCLTEKPDLVRSKLCHMLITRE